MSLIERRSTEAAVAASRANSLKSAGPTTASGKLRSRMNALEHGMRAEVGPALPELNERAEDLEKLKMEFWCKFEPRDDFEGGLLEQMAENRWRRRRVVRAESSLLLAHRFEFDLEHARAQASESRSPASAGEADRAQETGLASLPDSGPKFSFILQCLRAARQTVESEGFSEAGLKRLEAVYGPHPGLAGAAVLSCYRECQKTLPDGSQQEESPQYRTEFLALLDGEIGNFEELQDLHQASRDELAAALRETLSILPNSDLSRILRYETFLDRQYERLLKQLEGSQSDKGKRSRQSGG